jgi:hypothetical protein
LLACVVCSSAGRAELTCLAFWLRVERLGYCFVPRWPCIVPVHLHLADSVMLFPGRMTVRYSLRLMLSLVNLAAVSGNENHDLCGSVSWELGLNSCLRWPSSTQVSKYKGPALAARMGVIFAPPTSSPASGPVSLEGCKFGSDGIQGCGFYELVSITFQSCRQ